MKRKLLVFCALAVLLASCAAHTHVVGTGGSGQDSVTKRQLYVVAIVPINEIDTQAMAGNAQNYTIETRQTFVDGFISALAMGVIHIRSVTVTK